MKLLLDTHVLLWAAEDATLADREGKLSTVASELIDDPANTLHFSVVSIWEIAIKTGLGRKNFAVNPHLIRRHLLDNGYAELPVAGEHVLGVATLPNLHSDPFDRMLLAQANCEGMTLLTHDDKLRQYPGAVQFV